MSIFYRYILLEEQTQSIRNIITKKIIQNDVIDGTQLQNNWFPQINADVFISHSHQDLELATNFAAWLNGCFNLNSFIDSAVWGYANDLLKMIDDKLCYNNIMEVYDYNKRNYSTAHVHSMLSNALMQMIDKTECLFFLNTSNSVSVSDTVQNKTESPWLYLELSASQFIKATPPPNRGWTKTAGYIQNSRISMQYDVDLSYLTNITVNDLSNWKKTRDAKVNEHPLDLLYQICQPQQINR
ncbi:MAG: hypothetical protein LBQ50_02710 [Planctomycetaceae bacterium]|nr:hypothetical protein [Planctomycetaceae bacterium]